MKIGIKKFLFISLSVLLMTAQVCFAQVVERNPILRNLEAGGSKVEFIGNAYGLDGWIVVNPNGGVQYVYTTPEGALMTGMLFAPDGTPETIKQIKAYRQRATGSQAAMPGAENSSSKSEKLYAEVEKANWVSIGESDAPYLYVFVNVGCGLCHSFWKDLDAAVASGKLQVRLVPYGAMELNRDGAAALLSVERPDEAWRDYVAGDQWALGKDKIKDGAYSKVDANTVINKNWKLSGPPFTLYRRPASGVVTALVGRPENTMLLLAEFLK